MEFNSINFSLDALESMIVNDDQPSIEIDYDPDFLELEKMVAIKMEQQYGDTIIPATPIDWTRALNKAYELLNKSKDYRLCGIITRALTNKCGVHGTLKGIECIRLLTEKYWQSAYPAILFDDEIDFLPRGNAIAELTSPAGLLGDLRNTDIDLGAAGKISIGNIEKVFLGKSDNQLFSRDQLVQILHSESIRKNEDISTIGIILTNIGLLESRLAGLIGIEQTPDFSQLKSLLVNIVQADSNNNITAFTSDYIDSTADEFTDPSPTQSQIHLMGIQSRSDAITLLDNICNFLEKNDPANPAPLLIKRARNMIGKDFYTILSQLAPDAIAQAEQVTGTSF